MSVSNASDTILSQDTPDVGLNTPSDRSAPTEGKLVEGQPSFYNFSHHANTATGVYMMGDLNNELHSEKQHQSFETQQSDYIQSRLKTPLTNEMHAQGLQVSPNDRHNVASVQSHTSRAVSELFAQIMKDQAGSEKTPNIKSLSDHQHVVTTTVQRAQKTGIATDFEMSRLTDEARSFKSDQAGQPDQPDDKNTAEIHEDDSYSRQHVMQRVIRFNQWLNQKIPPQDIIGTVDRINQNFADYCHTLIYMSHHGESTLALCYGLALMELLHSLIRTECSSVHSGIMNINRYGPSKAVAMQKIRDHSHEMHKLSSLGHHSHHSIHTPHSYVRSVDAMPMNDIDLPLDEVVNPAMPTLAPTVKSASSSPATHENNSLLTAFATQTIHSPTPVGNPYLRSVLSPR